MSPHTPIENSRHPFDMTEYRLEASLTLAERTALSSAHSRSRMLRTKPVPDLIRPLMDIAAGSGCGSKITGLVIAGLLREMHADGMPCWCWPQETLADAVPGSQGGPSVNGRFCLASG